MNDGRRDRRSRSRSSVLFVPLVGPWPIPGASEVGPEELVEIWPPLVRAAWFLGGFIVVLLLGWYVLEPAITRFIRPRNRDNPTLQEALTRYVRALVVLVAILVGATIAGYGGILGDSAVIIAAVTLAVGVAGREVIGSLVSGLALVVDPEFNVGNVIEWSGGRGTVRSITLRVTRVLTPDGGLVTVPNTMLTGQAVVRPYGRGEYRVVERVGVDADADLDEAMRRITLAASTVDGILAEPAPRVYVDELGDESVILRVHYWIEDPRRQDVFGIRSAFQREVRGRLGQAGIAVDSTSRADRREPDRG